MPDNLSNIHDEGAASRFRCFLGPRAWKIGDQHSARNILLSKAVVLHPPVFLAITLDRSTIPFFPANPRPSIPHRLSILLTILIKLLYLVLRERRVNVG